MECEMFGYPSMTLHYYIGIASDAINKFFGTNAYTGHSSQNKTNQKTSGTQFINSASHLNFNTPIVYTVHTHIHKKNIRTHHQMAGKLYF